MSDEISVKIVGDASGFDSAASQASDSADRLSNKLKEIQGAAGAGAEGMNALEAAYYSVSGPAQQAAESAKALTDALSSGIPSASAFSDALSQMGKIALAVSGGLGIMQIAGTLKSAFEDATVGAFSWGESLTNLSIQTGMSVEQLQILERATLVSGKSLDSVTMIVNRLSRTMLEFASEKVSPKMQSAVELLGFNPADFTDAYSMLDGLSTRIAEIGPLSLAQRGAIEEMFGRSVLSALPWIEKLHEVSDSMRANNQILSNETVAANDDAAEHINTLKADFGALAHEIGGVLAPAMDGLIASFRTFANMPGGVGDFSNTKLAAGGPKDTGEMQAENIQPAADTQPAVESQKNLEKAIKDTQRAADEQARMIEQDAREMATGTDALWREIVQQHKDAAAADKAEAKDEADFEASMDKYVVDHVKAKWQELESVRAIAAENLKNTSAEIASAITPITSAFETSFTGVIQGTQTIGQAWKKMIDSMGLELLKSGLHDLLMGGTKGMIGASIFGETGAGGGIAGALATAFQGSAIQTGMKGALSGAWSGLTGIVGTVFGGAFRGIAGIVHSVFGTALQGVASAGAGAATSAVGGAAKQAATQVSNIPEIAQLTAMNAELIVINGTLMTLGIGIGTMEMMLGAMTVALDYMALPKVTETIITAPWGIGQSTGFTAAGGAIVPNDLMSGGGALSILHPREMVLPAHLSEGVQNAINGGSFGGGGGGGNPIIVNYSVSAMDGASVDRVLRQHGDVIASAVAAKVRDGRMTGQGVNRGAFRR